MDPQAPANLIDRILAANKPVLLTGPAGAGKTQAAMEFYRHHIDAAGRAHCLLLVPNSVTASALRRQMVRDSSTGVVLGPQVITFTSLAARVLGGSGVAACMISPPRRHMLLRQIVQELRQSGQLRALGPVADTPGIVAVLDRSIGELKRAAVEPEDLAQALAGTATPPKQADLLAVYRLYQQHLLEQNLYDIDGQMWAAREVLARVAPQSPLPGLDGISAIAAAGFTDFTPTQLGILRLLSAGVQGTLITLPLASDARTKMWHWTRRTREAITRTFGGNLHEIAIAQDAQSTQDANHRTQGAPKSPGNALPGLNTNLSALANSVFDFDAAPYAAPAGLAVIAAAGVEAEISAVARRVKRLLMSGAAPGSIAVLARSLDAVGPAIARVFAQHAIPVAAQAKPLTDSPLVRYLLDAAGIGGDFPFRQVMRTIRSSYFRPSALGPFTPRTVLVAEMIIREGNVLSGRESYTQAATRLAAKARGQLRARGVDGASASGMGVSPMSPTGVSPVVCQNQDHGQDAHETHGQDGHATDADDTVRLGIISAQPAEIDQAAAMLHRLFDLCQSAATPQGLQAFADALQLRQAVLQQYATYERTYEPGAEATGREVAKTTIEGEMPSGRADKTPSPQATPAPPQDTADADRIAADLRALGALEKALHELAQEAAATPVSLTLADIREALSAITIPPQRSESLVDVLSVLDARSLSYDHVFVVGLEENSFPQRTSEGSMIGEADRVAWSRRGVNLDARGDLNAREMLLFYLAITRAGRTLTLSYQSADASGKPSAPSAFLVNLLEPMGGLKALAASGQLTQMPAGQFIPPADEIASPRDAFNARVVGLFSPSVAGVSPERGNISPSALRSDLGDAPPDASDAASLRKAKPERSSDRSSQQAIPNPQSAIRNLSAGLLAMHRRWMPGLCDSFDGLITHDDLLEHLQRLIPDNFVFSASSLNAFGQCPWQFFATYVLGLTELTLPQRDLQAVSAGTFCHNVLWRVLSGLKTGPALALHEVSREDLLAALASAVAAQSAIVEATTPPYPVLWKLQREQLARDLQDYLLTQQADTALDARCLHFELAFGLGRLDEPHDAASQLEPIILDTPAGAIRFRGKIDRIDVACFGGLTGLLVVDYKTGRVPSEDDILTARNVQLPLYQQAAAAILAQPTLAGVFHQVGGDGKMRFFGRVKRRGDDYKPVDNFDQIAQQVMDRIGLNIASMRAGEFFALPDKGCPPYCPYRQICHYSPARAEMKTSE